MKVFLTGGAGYIGSACLRHLVRHGHQALAFDNLSEGNRSAVPDGMLWVGDLLDRGELQLALLDHKPDVVMHFAALASVPASIADPDGYYDVNFQGTKNLLDTMREVGCKRIVFSSTAATYGFHPPEAMPLVEDSPQRPEVPYGRSKLAAEWLIEDYARAYGMGGVTFRYFNASGADEDGLNGERRKTESHLIPLALSAALGKRAKLLVFGDDWPTRDGSCVRDYVHTEDLAQAHRLAASRLMEEPGLMTAYNLGNGEGTTVWEVVRACEKAVGRAIPLEVAARRDGDPAVLVASPEKAVRELGWKPHLRSIDDIVGTAWRWHQHAETLEGHS